MGLIGGLARTAGGPGMAAAVPERVSARQAKRWAVQTPPRVSRSTGQSQTPEIVSAPGRAGDEMLLKLQRLGELRACGVLSEAEFAAQRARIVGY